MASPKSQPRTLHPRLAIIVLSFFSTQPLSSATAAASSSKCTHPPIIFNFGDSNSDTGGLVAGLGYPVFPPNGRTYFRRSTGRLSDGRLVIDFLCQSVKTSFLSPYLDSLGSTFTNGANFAIVGSSTLPKYVPFALNVQVMQFLHFKARSLELKTAGSKDVIDSRGFQEALYMIDIGQNDLADSFAKNLTYAEVVNRIPSVVTEIKNAITAIYGQGGRKFWIHNTGPLGCIPQKLWLVQSKDLDSNGCISTYNDAAKLFNEGLKHLCQEVRSELKDASVVYVDIYSIKYDLIANATRYGFSNPLMACCGYGGPPYNYNINVTCGRTGYRVCDEKSRYVSWDGIHYTEAANSFVASRILSTSFSTPPVAFDSFCQ
uniref:Uncharacterized protein n=1 Tax=Kalanchoe fedtschenkoi TaxID=63787 RepID=A0A7N1A0F4_KALFE